jgi:hypothetical protein
VFGWVRLQADRLTDLINAHDSLLLTDVQIEGLEGGEPRSEERVLIAAEDLIAVHASGPRGDAGRGPTPSRSRPATTSSAGISTWNRVPIR